MSNSTEISIRPATAGDVGAISTILRELGWFNHVNKESPADTKARITQHLKLCNSAESHTVFVAENQNGEVVWVYRSSLATVLDVGWLRGLYL